MALRFSAKAPPAKTSEKGYRDENDKKTARKESMVTCFVPRLLSFVKVNLSFMHVKLWDWSLCVSTGEYQTVYFLSRFLTRRRIARVTSEKARNTAALEARRGAGS